MVDRSNSERLRGFCDRRTDGQTFAIVESLSRLKTIKHGRIFGFHPIMKQIKKNESSTNNERAKKLFPAHREESL